MPLVDREIDDARSELCKANCFLVSKSIKALAAAPSSGPLWGSQMKRIHVDLAGAGRPASIGKNTERFVEVVNMVATLERLIGAWACLEEKKQELGGLRVKECHPATSSAEDGNDIVLENSSGAVAIRCEVSDVASDSASSNNKEKKDLASLGCADGVPSDGVRRLLCTSPEFADAIQRLSRKWGKRHYRYEVFASDPITETVLLEVVAPSLIHGH